MRRPWILVAAVLILGVGIASAVAFAWAVPEERAPESLLPADSAIYLGWDGTEKHKAAWEQTACYESLDKTHVLRTLTDLALSYIPPDSSVPAKAVRQMLDGIGRRGISVAVAVPKEHSLPRVVVVLHQAAGLEAAFSSAIPKLAGPAANFETVTIRGRRVTRVILETLRDNGKGAASSSAPELAWWAEGGHLVLVFGEGAVAAALDVADGKSPALPSTANWRKYREEPKDFHAIAAAWCDVAALRARYGDYAMQEKTDTAPKFTVGQLIDLLGGERMGCVALRCGLQGRALVSEATIEAPAPRTGLLALADQAPISLADLPPLPKDTTGFAVASFNGSRTYDGLLKLARQIGDAAANKGSAKVDEVMNGLPAMFGFDPKTELLDTLGHVWCMYGDSAAGIPGGLGFGIAVSVEKPDVLQKTLKTAFEKLQTMFPNGLTVAEEERSGRPTWVFDLMNLPVHPAAALDKHWLLIGLTPQSIESALLRIDGKLDRWKPSTADQAALDSVPKQFIALSLADRDGLESVCAGTGQSARGAGGGEADGPVGRHSAGRGDHAADVSQRERGHGRREGGAMADAGFGSGPDGRRLRRRARRGRAPTPRGAGRPGSRPPHAIEEQSQTAHTCDAQLPQR
jgi:hypothetical protein